MSYPVKIGFAPTRRSIFSAPDAIKFANLTRERLGELGVEFVDITDINETLATRPVHEKLTNQVGDLMRELGADPYILSTEACAECERCAYLDGQPCRFPQRMHPCVESHGINVIPTLEENGLEFQYGENVVTWISLLFF